MILRSRDNQALGWMPVYRFNIPAVARQCALFYSLVEVPDFKRAIIGSSDKLGISRRESSG